MVLTGQEIIARNAVTSMIDTALQVQGCGIDLSIEKIETFASSGTLDFDNSKRVLPRLSEAGHIKYEYRLPAGAYLVTYNEVVNIPRDCCAIARPRSSLLRVGATIETALWDAGYKGRSQSMLVVHNRNGLTLYKNARVAQLVFLPLSQATEKLYSGTYQGEGIKIEKYPNQVMA